MQAIVNQNCISCGLCATICPEIFTIDETDGLAHGGNFENELLDAAQEARDSCPVSAISLE